MKGRVAKDGSKNDEDYGDGAEATEPTVMRVIDWRGWDLLLFHSEKW